MNNLGQIEKIFSISALTPGVKPLGANLFKYYWPLIIFIHTSTFLVVVAKFFYENSRLNFFS
jgi:hypothetical protein